LLASIFLLFWRAKFYEKEKLIDHTMIFFFASTISALELKKFQKEPFRFVFFFSKFQETENIYSKNIFTEMNEFVFLSQNFKN